MLPVYVKAKLACVANGRHGPYMVVFIEWFRDFRGTIPITASLDSDVWQDEFTPKQRRDEGMYVLLRWDMIFKKPKGWRAMWARMYRPEDDALLKTNEMPQHIKDQFLPKAAKQSRPRS